jgi:uncharacterized protein (TIRG00374 family)
METGNQYKVISIFSAWRILIPIALGLGISGFMIGRSMNADVFNQVDWGLKTIFWLALALFGLLLRDFMNMIRIRQLTGKHLSWKKSFQVIMLWEFGASVTPAVIGGGAVAFFIVHKEGIPFGRSTATVMITSLLDELFFVLTVPFIFLILRSQGFLGSTLAGLPMSQEWVFWLGYFYIVFLMLFITTALFVLPRQFKKLIVFLFHFPFLRRWQSKAEKMGNDLITASKEMRGQSFAFWVKNLFVTFVAWTARFFIINCIIMAFMPSVDHFALFSRQMIMWVVMLISPTPGSSGIAEWMFSDYLGMFVLVGLAPLLAVIWRLMTFYYYLIIGSLVLPVWVRRVFNAKT